MELFMYTLRSLAYVIMEPSLMIMLILLGVMFYSKNKKVTDMQKMVIGDKVNSTLELTLSQIVLGILGGILASVILSNLGIIFKENSGIELLFLVSILMMFIKSRFICFSYSAAVLGVLSLIFTYFNLTTSSGGEILAIDIMCLMTFVGVLHIVEGILVMVDGDKGAIPVFSNKGGHIAGGYAFKRYWAIPIAVFIAFTISEGGLVGNTESIATPTFWPILKNTNTLALISSMALSLIPFFGVMGYSSVTFTKPKRRKVMYSGASLIIYGLLLVLVAQCANFGLAGEILAIVFAPLGHELMVYIQKKDEDKNKPLFISDEEGIAVLEVVPYSIAYENGIRVGDKIVTVNGEVVVDITEVHKLVGSSIHPIDILIRDIKGVEKSIRINPKKGMLLGAVLVPRNVSNDKVIPFQDERFSEVLNKIKENRKDIK